MSRPAILDAFTTHGFLQRLDDHCLMDLASGVQPFTLKRGEYLAHKGEPARAFYLVQSGIAVVGHEHPTGEVETLWTIGPGGAIGWSWLVPPHRWHYSCWAETTMQGLVFDAAWLRDRCERNHELGYHLLKEMIASMTGQFAANSTAQEKLVVS